MVLSGFPFKNHALTGKKADEPDAGLTTQCHGTTTGCKAIFTLATKPDLSVYNH
jgi:hypothetical protein